MTVSKRGCRGVTFVEILVAITVMGIATALLAGFFAKAARITASESLGLEMEQSCQFLMKRIERELQSSGVSGLSLYSAPAEGLEAFSVNPIDDISVDGDLAWKREQAVFLWTSREQSVVRFVRNQGSGVSLRPKTYSGPDFEQFVRDSGLERTELASGVTGFQLEAGGLRHGKRLLTLRLELTRQDPEKGARVWRFERNMALRN